MILIAKIFKLKSLKLIMKTITSVFVILMGIILLLPLLGVTSLGTPISGILGWAFAMIVLFLGIYHLMINLRK